MKVVIIGGVAGGASAATRLRRLSEDAQIVLFEKGEYVSYANCGLPYYIGGAITQRERLIVARPELLRERFNIDVRVRSEVVAIDRAAKTVTVRNHADGDTYLESYDKLLLSPGGEPRRPDLPGLDEPGIFTLRTVPDTFAIDDYIHTAGAKRAVVVGAGFIGVEMAENLRERGLDVTVIEYLDQALGNLDPEMAAIAHNHMRRKGLQLLFGVGVRAFSRTDQLHVHISDGRTLHTDMVIVSIGVQPDNTLARQAGLTIGIGGGIEVDQTYRTSDADIYAVGDAIVVRTLPGDRPALVPLAGPANKQGRLAAAAMLGQATRPLPVQGSAILKVFDMTAASTGLNEKQLIKQGVPYGAVHIHPSSHATYYPGATQLSMKLLYAPQDGRLLGAQAIGYDGVDKRIDVLATALRLHATVYDLEELELCYAPPYSSAKDPVNMLGFVAANHLRGDVKSFHYHQVDALDRAAVTILDTRTPQEMHAGSIEGALNIPVDELRARMGELPRDKPVYAYCRVGMRGYVAARILAQHGYDVYNLSGGYMTYGAVLADRRAARGEQPQATPPGPRPVMTDDTGATDPSAHNDG